MILASSSERRQEILKSIGFNFEVIPANIDETSDKSDIIERVEDIAFQKAKHIAQNYPDKYVLAADTIVEKDNRILGKPKDEREAKLYLEKLSGGTHRVITAYSFINIAKNIYLKNYDISIVKFYDLDDKKIEWYLETGEPFDKAGAYGIQGKGRIFVEKIEGDFFSIMGFPIGKFMQDLKNVNININDISKL